MKAEKLETPSTPDVTTYVAERRALLTEPQAVWDPRLALTLDRRIQILDELAREQNPGRRFTRTVPVQATDHDVVIRGVLNALESLRNDEERQLAVIEAAAALRDEVRTIGECSEPWHYEVSLAGWRRLSYALDALTGGSND